MLVGGAPMQRLALWPACTLARPSTTALRTRSLRGSLGRSPCPQASRRASHSEATGAVARALARGASGRAPQEGAHGSRQPLLLRAPPARDARLGSARRTRPAERRVGRSASRVASTRATRECVERGAPALRERPAHLTIGAQRRAARQPRAPTMCPCSLSRARAARRPCALTRVPCSLPQSARPVGRASSQVPGCSLPPRAQPVGCARSQRARGGQPPPRRLSGGLQSRDLRFPGSASLLPRHQAGSVPWPEGSLAARTHEARWAPADKNVAP